jgi:hypothetical protein
MIAASLVILEAFDACPTSADSVLVGYRVLGFFRRA